MRGADVFFLTCVIGVAGLFAGLALSLGESWGGILAVSAMSSFITYSINKSKVVDAFCTPAVVGGIGNLILSAILPIGQLGVILAAATAGSFIVLLGTTGNNGDGT